MAEKTVKEKNIASAFAEVLKFDQNGEYERSLKACNRILQMSPMDGTAFHCKVICYIQMSKFDEAFQTINKNMILSSPLVFERAYCLYRLNRNDEALQVIGEVEDPEPRLKELSAQIHYRMENYKESLDIYHDIIKNAEDEYEDERETNLSAVISYNEKEEIDRFGDDIRDDSYELCFNKACSLISVEKFNEAEKMLKKCEKLCRDSLEEDGSTEEEIDLELAHVKVQMGYVFQKQGRVKEAQAQYNKSLKLKLDDPALAAVASNNAVVINRDQNVFDSKKKMRVATNESLTFKLPSRQRKFIALNNAIFGHYTHQCEVVARACSQIIRDWPELGETVTILEAMTLVARDRLEEAVTHLRTYSAPTRDDQLYLHLVCIHLLLTHGFKERACVLIEGLGSSAYKPGIIGALITLYLHLGKEDVALKVFEDTVEWYKKNKRGEGDLTTLFRQAAEFHIRNGRPHVAANSLEQLIAAGASTDAVNTNDYRRSIAQLVIAYAQYDGPRAIETADKACLGAVVNAMPVDREQLESTSWLTAKKASKTELSPGAPQTPDTGDKQHRRKQRKKRKGKLPHNYIEGQTPDPERWLPKYERTGFRKKRDRRNKDVIKGSQGTTSGQADQFDFTKVMEQQQEESPSSVDPSPAMSRNQHQQRKGNPKKSKNKRR